MTKKIAVKPKVKPVVQVNKKNASTTNLKAKMQALLTKSTAKKQVKGAKKIKLVQKPTIKKINLKQKPIKLAQVDSTSLEESS